MTRTRTYGDPCGIARALDVVGERWALLVVRELLLGPKRFTDLRAGLPNLSPDVLSQRLRELEADGLVTRRRLPPPAGSKVYELTERGLELEPVILALGRWGTSVPFPPDGHELGPDSTILALKTVFDPKAARNGDLSVELRLAEQTFSVQVDGRGIEIARGSTEDPDAVLTTSAMTLVALLWQGLGLGEALRSGAAEIEGDRRKLERFLGLFAVGSDVGQQSAVRG
ncbi:MAG: winged helix-turn-helix transcriptional regulator [Thermoleophilaceae bacterium]